MAKNCTHTCSDTRPLFLVSGASTSGAHNHPSGSAELSRAREFLTQTLRTALVLVDVRVIDHLVVAGADVCTFAERGLL